MKSGFVSTVLGLMLFAQTATAQDTSLELAATEYPPFYGAELEDNGFMTEIIIEAFSRAGYTSEVSFLPWSRAIEGTRDGRYDGLFTMWYREDREADFIFSDPLPANEIVLITRSGEEFEFQSFAALPDINIGIVRGYAPPPGFEDAGLTVSEGRDHEENLRKLLRGRLDAVLADRIVAQSIINSAMPDDAEAFGWVTPPVHTDIQYLVVPRGVEGSDALMSAFNASLTMMRGDGTLQGIMAEHGFDDN